MSKIYLDYAAATPMDDEVLQAMKPYFSEKFQNPSAVYLDSRNVKKDIEEARAEVAHWLGAKPMEIVFTAGGSEADNLAIFGVANKYDDAHILISAIEHEAVIKAAEKFDHDLVKVDKNGQLDLADLKNKVTDKTVLISVMYANNEIGTVQNLSEISQVISDIKEQRLQSGNDRELVFHSDASQAVNYLDLHVSRLGVDLMTLNGSKIYGPKQSGALYVSSKVELEPIVYGGGQEKGLRSGTENVSAIVGFSKALTIAQKERSELSKQHDLMRMKLFKDIESDLPGISLVGPKKKRLPNNLSVRLDGVDGERAVMELDEAGVQAATGSACSALKDQSSHVLKAIGLSEEEASSTLRFSLGRPTTDENVTKSGKIIAETLKNHIN